MDNYEQLKQIIQAANPEIMELKFGCEFLYKGLHYIYATSTTTGKHWAFRGWHPNDWASNENTFVSGGEWFEAGESKGFQITGRPIRLADVLLAVDKVSSQYSVGADGRFTFLDITKDGTSGLEWVKESNGNLALTWNLKDDNLDHQSDETKQFLIDLLIQPS